MLLLVAFVPTLLHHVTRSLATHGRNKILNSTILDLVIGARIRLYT